MESCFYCLVNKIYRGKNGSIESRIFLVNIETKSMALVYGAKRNDYSFPKGHKEDDGTLGHCAIRETAEETRRVAEIVNEFEPYIERYTTPRGENCACYIYIAVDNGISDNTCKDTYETY